ncbi:Uncharacterised protein [Streptococcus pneumoniae]|nr:Uncharacterised protein [Streptococcus pneumoniae]
MYNKVILITLTKIQKYAIDSLFFLSECLIFIFWIKFNSFKFLDYNPFKFLFRVPP